MSTLAEIILPPGTLKVMVTDVPVLFAKAIYPDLPSDAPRLLTALAKQTILSDGTFAPDDEPLTGADRTAEEKLLAAMDRDAGVELSYDTDWGLLEAIWADLPPLELPIRETEWQKYADAFQSSRIRPNWKLVALWKSPSIQNDFARAATEYEHEKALDAALLTGEVVPRSLLSLCPNPTLMGNQLNHAFITIDELRAYAAKFLIGVSFAPPPTTQELPAKINESEAWIAKAVSLAQAIGLKKWQSGERQITARKICHAVATELEKGEPDDPQKYHGTQGPRAADAIRSKALKGWKFIYPSGTDGINGTDGSKSKNIPLQAKGSL